MSGGNKRGTAVSLWLVVRVNNCRGTSTAITFKSIHKYGVFSEGDSGSVVNSVKTGTVVK